MTNIHLKFAAKITGESIHKKHPGEIGIESASWSVHNDANSNKSTGKGGGKALSTCGHLNLVKKLDKASPELMWSCSKGDDVADAVLTFTKEVNGKFIDYLLVKMYNVKVSSYQISGASGGEDMESFSLAFSKVEFTFTAEDQGGIKGASVMKSYDFASSDAG